MSTTDEGRAHELRARVDAVAPQIDVDVDRVIPRARRRRAILRGAVGATTVTVVLVAAWGAASVLGSTPSEGFAPAGTPTRAPVSEEGAPTEPSPDVRPTIPAAAVVAEDGTVTGVPGDPWEGEDRYWYQLTESRGSVQQDEGSPVLGEVERSEVWASRERPGLLVSDGDLSNAAAMGPRIVMGSFVVAGLRYEMLADPRVLPTDAEGLAQVLRDSLEPDRGAGSDDDKVIDAALAALREGGVYDRALRDAFWGVLASLPGVVLEEGEDGIGRTGEVLRYTASDGTEQQIVRDASTGLLLEIGTPDGTTYSRYLEQRPRDDLPLEPTLEVAGCAGWATC